jgi:transcription elongation factor GreA
MTDETIPVFDHDAPPLSPEAHARLKAEHEDLVTRGRIDIARKIEAARELGDLSENGDYHAAKEEQGKMQGRILHLENLLENAVVVELGPRLLSLRYEGDTDAESYLLGLVDEKIDDASIEILSPKSALGQALMGHRPGDTVEFQAPNGNTLRVEVVSVGS